jgi:hypothetical protein
MSIMLLNAAISPAPERLAAFERAWANLIAAGPTLSAAERIGVIVDARAAWAGSPKPNDASGPLGGVAHWLAVDAGGFTADTVDDLEARGLDRFRYLEAVGIVGRLSNLDFYARGLGASLPEPPAVGDATDGPTGEFVREAALTNGWVPAMTAMFAPGVLDALPAEGDALRDLHEPMYMPMNEMGDNKYFDELSRAQIEYIAARASYLNECFY